MTRPHRPTAAGVPPSDPDRRPVGVQLGELRKRVEELEAENARLRAEKAALSEELARRVG